MLEKQQWQGAADIAALLVERLIDDLPAEPVVANLNVPNCPAEEMKGWKRTAIGTAPPRSMARATLDPKPGHDGAYTVKMSWGDVLDTPTSDDTGAVMAGYASVSWLGRLEAVDPDATVVPAAERALDDFFA